MSAISFDVYGFIGIELYSGSYHPAEVVIIQ